MNDASLPMISEHFALSICLSEKCLLSLDFPQIRILFLNQPADKNLLSSYYVPGTGYAVVNKRVTSLLPWTS